jgi:hypothetical protein
MKNRKSEEFFFFGSFLTKGMFLEEIFKQSWFIFVPNKNKYGMSYKNYSGCHLYSDGKPITTTG